MMPERTSSFQLGEWSVAEARREPGADVVRFYLKHPSEECGRVVEVPQEELDATDSVKDFIELVINKFVEQHGAVGVTH